MLNRGALYSKNCLRQNLGLRIQNSSCRSLQLKDRWISSKAHRSSHLPKWTLWFAGAAGASVVTWALWRENQSFRHTVLAAARCSRVGSKLLSIICRASLNSLFQSLLFLVLSITRPLSRGPMNQRRRSLQRTRNATRAVRRGC